MSSIDLEVMDGDEPRCASGPDDLGADLKWGCSSKEVFMSYVYIVSSDPLVYNATQIISKRCYDSWIATRRSHPKSPEKSFQRSLTAHIVGSGGRRPFRPEVEAPLLEELRQKRVWPCFEGTNCQIGLFGIRVKGFHEKRAAEKNSQQQQQQTENMNTAVKESGRVTRSSIKQEVSGNNQQTSEQMQWNGIQMGVNQSSAQSRPLRTYNTNGSLYPKHGGSDIQPGSPSRRFDGIQFPKLRSYDTATSIASDMSLPGLLDALPSDGKKSRLRSYGSSNRSDLRFETQLFPNLMNEAQQNSEGTNQTNATGNVPWNYIPFYVDLPTRIESSQMDPQQQQQQQAHGLLQSNRLSRHSTDFSNLNSNGQKHNLAARDEGANRQGNFTNRSTLSRQATANSTSTQKTAEMDMIWNTAPRVGSPGGNRLRSHNTGEFQVGITGTNDKEVGQQLFRNGLLRYDTNSSAISRHTLQRHNSLKSDNGNPGSSNSRLRKQHSSQVFASLDLGNTPIPNIWDKPIEEEGIESKLSSPLSGSIEEQKPERPPSFPLERSTSSSARAMPTSSSAS